jgi:hypothetical protein
MSRPLQKWTPREHITVETDDWIKLRRRSTSSSKGSLAR